MALAMDSHSGPGPGSHLELIQAIVLTAKRRKEKHLRAKRRHHVQPRRPLVSRLIGLETEYATMVADPQSLDQDDLPSARFVYQQICEAIRREQPAVAGVFDREQMFLANGGAVSFESHPSVSSQPGGLVEIATPEVRSPSDLLACQRSIDQLAAEATENSETSFDLRILKNSSDALGHVYGCHENYETEVGSGLNLLVYRGFVLLLWMIQTISLLVAMPLMVVVMGLMGLSRLSRSRKTKTDTADSESSFDENDFGFGSFDDQDLDNEIYDTDTNRSEEFYESMPRWLSWVLVGLLRLVHLPTVFTLTFVAQHIAFRRQRKYLTAMLISRVSLCGAGNLSPDGCFQMSAKAMAVDSVAHMGGFRGERPIYVFGHWLSQYCAKSFFSLGSTKQMFHRRQRMQIALSDSNMSDLAEYVKVGSVSLLLDMIEANYTKGIPIVRSPVDSLHRLASDWNLVTKVPTSLGPMTALQIQKLYLSTARAFVESVPANLRGEAKLVLYRWQELYDGAARFRKNATDTGLAIGRVDWLTKRHLIDSLDTDLLVDDPKLGASETSTHHWSARKKIDLRYHELSEEGYYSMLLESRPELNLVNQEQIDRRRKSPPAGSPAARRGWLIREFGDSDEKMQSEWAYAIIGHGKEKRRVDFFEDV